MKRVAMISFHTCPYERLGMFDAGGMNVYITGLCQHLVYEGWLVDIYTRNHQQRHTHVSRRDSVSLIHLPVAYGVKKEKLIDYTDEFAESIAKEVKKSGTTYHVLHGHYFLSGLSATKLKQKLNVPLVVTFHTLAKLKEVHGGKKDDRRYQAECELLKDADKIIVFTRLEQAELIRYYQADIKKIEVTPPGINIADFNKESKKARKMLKLKKNIPIILFVGRIDPIKDVASLIEAVFKLHQDVRFKDKFRLILIGGDLNKESPQKNEIKKLKSLISQKKLDCCIQFVGSVPHRDLLDYYASADIVVLPSLYESFGLVALEAMASSKAVVASSVGGLQSLIEDGKTGLLFPSRDVGSLAGQLARLITDKKLRKTLSRNAKKKSALYSWEKPARRVAKVYETVHSEGVAL